MNIDLLKNILKINTILIPMHHIHALLINKATQIRKKEINK